MACKPACTYEQQALILKEEHGLEDCDLQYAVKALRLVNYYNLRGYYIHWMDRQQKLFRKGITFNMILRLRDFDERLRNLIWPALLHVEIRFRTHIAYYIAHKFSPMGYLDASNFKSAQFAEAIIKDINKAVSKSDREIFIQHHKKNYNGEFPIWVIVEVLPFGVLTMLYGNLLYEDKTKIALEHYGLDGKVVNSYLAALSTLRNVCAHNGRVYNKALPVGIIVSSSNEKKLIDAYGSSYANCCTFPSGSFDRSLFAILLALRDLTPTNNFVRLVEQLEHLLDEYSDVACPQRLGLPLYWGIFLREK